MTPKEHSDQNQLTVADWVIRAWGWVCLHSKRERVQRVLEEAIELHQVEAHDEADAHRLVSYVYGRPVGEAQQETAGVAVTLLGYAQSKGFSLFDVTEVEIARVLAKDIASLRAKHAAKTAAGVSDVKAPQAVEDPVFVREGLYLPSIVKYGPPY